MMLAALVYEYCFTGCPAEKCRLIIERFMTHYFRGSDYRSDPKLESLFEDLFVGRRKTVDGGIPLNLLVEREPQRYEDRNVNALAFDTEVISDYLFYERGWDTTSANAEELRDQRDLLFTVLPLGNLRLFSSLNFALSRRIDLSGSSDDSSTSEEEESPSLPSELY